MVYVFSIVQETTKVDLYYTNLCKYTGNLHVHTYTQCVPALKARWYTDKLQDIHASRVDKLLDMCTFVYAGTQGIQYINLTVYCTNALVEFDPGLSEYGQTQTA